MTCQPTCRPILLLIAVFVMGSGSRVNGQDFGAVANGNWNNAATWTPAGGPPGAGQNAFIGATSPAGSAAVVTVTLTADQEVRVVDIGRNGGTDGTLALNSVLTVNNDLTIGRFGGVGTITHGGGHFVANRFFVQNANNFTFAAADIATSLNVESAAAVTTSSLSNVSSTVRVNGVSSQLNLGAQLDLTEDLEIRGSLATPATVQANGNNVTARDIFIGRFGNAGDILNDGAIAATRDLEVSAGTFTLDANDSVAATVSATVGGTLTLHANTAADNAFVGSDATLNMVATNNVSRLVLLNGANAAFDMGANLNLTQDLDIRGINATTATVQANGNDITARDIFIGRFGNVGEILNDGAIAATRDLEVSAGTFTLDANDSVADTVSATVGGTLTLHANTAADNAFVGSDATLNMVATNNVSRLVLLNGANAAFDMGANLNLTQDLDIRGINATTATVQANGNDITARDIFIGRFGNVGEILNDGAIAATRDLEVSRGTFALDANDSVADTVSATSGGTLTLHANTAADNAFVGSDATLNMVATNNVSRLVFLNGANAAFDMGANLNLTQDLDIRGINATTATVQANGNDITARDIFIGRFGNVGEILNDGAIAATRDLEVSRGTFALDANDSVADTVSATSGGTLTLHANTAADNAFVGSDATLNMVATNNVSRLVSLSGANATFDMGTNLNLTEDLDIRGDNATTATVQANGNDITARDIFIGRFGDAGDILNDGAIAATRDLEVSRGTFALDANDSVADTVSATSGGMLTLHANTAADNAFVGSDGTLNTVAPGNVFRAVVLSGDNGTLNLGANLNLSEDLDIRGLNVALSTVQANGFDVAARDVFVGRFGFAGALVDTGLVTVGRNLEVDSSSVQLDGGFDTVGSALRVFSASTLSVNQDADSVRGLSLEGSILEILDTSVLALSFDNTLSNVADWVFRWAGEHVADINALIGNGRITVSAPHGFTVVNNGDGYTYVSNFQADFNGDDQLNCIDIDLLTAAVVAGSMDLMFDLTGDGMVTVADRDAWLAGAGAAFLASGNPYLPGDANLDGFVDGLDFIIWNQNKFTNIAAWCSGDFNADGVVDGLDFIIWNSNKFQAADAMISHVPEPNLAWIFAVAGLLLLRRWRG